MDIFEVLEWHIQQSRECFNDNEPDQALFHTDASLAIAQYMLEKIKGGK